MEKKALLGLMVILLALSHVISVPATRILVGKRADPSSTALDHHAKEAMDLKSSSEEVFEMDEEAGKGRMMMDVVDYPGPKANHNPRSPGGKPGF